MLILKLHILNSNVALLNFQVRSRLIYISMDVEYKRGWQFELYVWLTDVSDQGLA